MGQPRNSKFESRDRSVELVQRRQGRGPPRCNSAAVGSAAWLASSASRSMNASLLAVSARRFSASAIYPTTRRLSRNATDAYGARYALVGNGNHGFEGVDVSRQPAQFVQPLLVRFDRFRVLGCSAAGRGAGALLVTGPRPLPTTTRTPAGSHRHGTTQAISVIASAMSSRGQSCKASRHW